jgi:hypothetical protein
MMKKFFSIALLLTMCAVVQAEQAAVVVAPTATVTVPASKPAAAVVKAVDSKECTGSFLCSWIKPLWSATYGSHPYITLSVAGVATVAALYNYSETVRALFGQGSADCEKCPCPQQAKQ